MPYSNNIKSFVIRKILGALFILCAAVTAASLISFDSADQGFGTIDNSKQIQNLLGFIGSYYASFSMIFLNHTSYLMSLFLIFSGTWLLVQNARYNLLLKLCFFIIGIFFLNLSLSYYF